MLAMRSSIGLKKLIVYGLHCKSNQKPKLYSGWKIYGSNVLTQDFLLKTEMLVQDGSKIHELPIAVRKTCDIDTIFEEKKKIERFMTNAKFGSVHISKANHVKKSLKSAGVKKKSHRELDSTVILFDSDLEVLKNLDVKHVMNQASNSSKKLHKNSNLESMIHKEINSRVALQSLRQIINQDKKNCKLRKSNQFFHDRHLLMGQLIEFIVSSQDSEMILGALSIFLKDKFNPLNNLYRCSLTNEALLRISSGDFSMQQLIDLSTILCTFRDPLCYEAIDYFWVGFEIKQNEITPNNLISLFRLLKHLRKSKERVQILLEKKLAKNYHLLSSSQIIEILNMRQIHAYSPTVVESISNWININMATVSKFDLLELMESLNGAKYVDSKIEGVVEKILTAKNLGVNDHALVAAVGIYCTTLHLKNDNILKKMEDYLGDHAQSIPPTSFFDMINAFGELGYKPQGKKDFWKTFEKVLNAKFTYFSSNDILSTLVSCSFINKYFLTCINKLFSQQFLDHLDLHTDIEMLQSLRDKLYLLDIAMSIECPGYGGPYLARDCKVVPSSTNLKTHYLLDSIKSHLIKLAGSEEELTE